MCSVALSRGRYPVATIAATGAVAVASVRSLFCDWAPCGYVVGEKNGVRDFRDFDGEGRAHAWLGRFGTEFDSYGIGQGQLPHGVVEGSGGLFLLVRKCAPAYVDTDFHAFVYKRGVVAWALVDLISLDDAHEQTDVRGVLLVIGSRLLRAAEAADLLVAIGARDAVATDQSASVLLGACSSIAVGPPSILRQGFQQYGFYCA
jgi:hypothetical protein